MKMRWQRKTELDGDEWFVAYEGYDLLEAKSTLVTIGITLS